MALNIRQTKFWLIVGPNFFFSLINVFDIIGVNFGGEVSTVFVVMKE